MGDADTATDKAQWGAPAVPDVIAPNNLYWQFQTGLGRTASVVETANVELPNGALGGPSKLVDNE